MLLDKNKQKLLHQQLDQTHDFYLLLSTNIEPDGINQHAFSNATEPIIIFMIADFLIHYSKENNKNLNSILNNIASTCDMLQKNNI